MPLMDGQWMGSEGWGSEGVEANKRRTKMEGCAKRKNEIDILLNLLTFSTIILMFD